jgi:hypothetical protein
MQPGKGDMNKLCLMISLGAAAFGIFAPLAPADEWNKETKLTFSAPIEVPGRVLPAGTYEFKLLDSPSDRNIVQIFNAGQTQLLDTVLAIPDQRMRATGKTVVQFAERPANSPEAIKAWFYPGSQTGLMFVYPHDRAAELAKANKEPVYSTHSDMGPYTTKHMKAGDPDATKMKHSQVKSVQPDGSENETQPTNP